MMHCLATLQNIFSHFSRLLNDLKISENYVKAVVLRKSSLKINL